MSLFKISRKGKRVLRYLSFLIFGIIIIFAKNVFAADPGHGAAAISSGAFEAGNYTFPNSVFVGDYFGLGIISPTSILHLNSTGQGTQKGIALQSGSTISNIYISGSSSNYLTLVGYSGTKVMPSSASGTAFIVEGRGSQSGNLFEINTNGTSGGNLVIVNANGNVGIGTITPLQKLSVIGNITATGVVNGTQLCINGDCRTSWDNAGSGLTGSGSAGNVTYWTNATNLGNSPIFINGTTRNVGIGTTSPVGTLEVSGANSYFSNGNDYGTLRMVPWTSGTYYFELYNSSKTGSGSAFHFTGYSGSPDLVTMDITNSKVGILSSAITETLTVNGNASFNGIVNARGNRITNVGYPALGPDAASKDYVDALTSGGIALWTRVGTNTYLNNTGDNVGIGTTTPNSKLEIEGSDTATLFRLQETGSASNYLNMSNIGISVVRGTGSNTGFTLSTINSGAWGSGSDAGDIILKTNNTERMRVDVSGNVGIGTTAPGNSLEIQKQANPAVSAGTSLGFGIYSTVGDGTEHNSFLQSYNGDLLLNPLGNPVGIGYTNVSSTAALAINGNVGIGTTAPNALLESLSTTTSQLRLTNNANSYLDVNVGASAGVRIKTPNSATDTNDIYLLPDRGFIIAPYTYTGTKMNQGEKLEVIEAGNNLKSGIGLYDFSSQTTDYPIISFYKSQTNTIGTKTTTGTGSILGRFSAYGVALNPTYVEAGRIDFVQNTAGTGGSYLGGEIQFWTGTSVSSAISQKMVIDNTGNVGIGTTAPAEKLDIQSASSPAMRLKDTTNENALSLIVDDNNAYIRQVTGTGKLQFQTNGSNTAIAIDTSQNVGIGTTSPGTKLEVNDYVGNPSSTYSTTLESSNFKISANSVTGTGLLMGIGASAAYTWIQSQHSNNDVKILALNPVGGNVGIGTTTPAEKLTVNGNASITGILDMKNYRIINLAAPTLSSDAANKGYVDALTSGGIALWTRVGTNTYLNNTGDNVGIGTTAPGAKLHVSSGNITLSSGYNIYSGNAGIEFGDGTFGNEANDLTLYVAGGGELNFAHNGALVGAFQETEFSVDTNLDVRNPSYNSVFFVNRTSGNVGIGTTAPAQKLNVKGVERITRSTQDAHYIEISAEGGLGKITETGGLGISFYNGATQALTAISGNVGIGTTTPAGKLDIVSSGGKNGLNIITTSGAGTSASLFINTTTKGDYRGFYLYQSGGSGDYYEGALFEDARPNTASSVQPFVKIYRSGVLTRGNILQVGADSSANALVVDNRSYVGIGTATPGRKLTINGVTGFNSGATESMYVNPTSTGADLYMINSVGGAGLRFDTRANGNSYINVGNLGIGTTNPAEKLTVNGNASITGILDMKNTRIINLATPTLSNDAATKAYVDSAIGSGLLGTGSAGNVTYWINATTLGNSPIYFNATSGNVGIGTTTPSAKLEVNGSIKTTSITLGSHNGIIDLIANNYLGLGATASGIRFDSGLYGETRPLYDNTYELGRSNYRWSTIYGINGTFSGNVGIGTTSPAGTLEVTGSNTYFSGSTGYGTLRMVPWTAGSYYFELYNSSKTGSGSAFHFTGYSGNPDLVTMDITNSKVGILSSAITETLTVNGNASFNGILNMKNYRITNLATPVLSTDAATKAYVDVTSGSGLIGSGSSGYIALWNGTTSLNKSVITQSGGNIQIASLSGSAEPTSLYLKGGATSGVQMRIGDTYTASIGTRYSGAETFVTSNAYQNTLSTDSWSKGATTYGSTAVILGIPSSSSSAALQIKFSPANTSTGNFGSFYTSTLMTVLANGYVGIGTASPAVKLDVAGSVVVESGNSVYFRNPSNNAASYIFDQGASGQNLLTFRTASTDRMVIDNSGNVGIGTTVPAYKLDVAGNISFYPASGGLVSRNYGTIIGINDKAIIKNNAVGNGGLGLSAYNDQPISFWTSSGTTTFAEERMRILDNGNIGIGTTAPGHKLDVYGNISATGFVNGTQLCINGDCKPSWEAATNLSGWMVSGTIVNLTKATNRVVIGTSVGNNKATGQASLYVQGDLEVDGNFFGSGADIAENFNASESMEAGDVAVIDIDHPETVRKSNSAYSTLVAGVVSTNPGTTLGTGVSADGKPVALAGRVPVKVIDENGAIMPGDLLTSSSMSGYAMKCPSRERCAGAIIGKALESFDGKEGKIKVLIALG